MVRLVTLLVVLSCRMPSLSAAEKDDVDPRWAHKERLEKFYKDHRNNLTAILAEKDKTLMLGGYWMYLNRDNTKVLHYERRESVRARMVGMLSTRNASKSPRKGWTAPGLRVIAIS